MAITVITSTAAEASSQDVGQLATSISLAADQTIQIFADKVLSVGEVVTATYTPDGSVYLPLVDGNKRNVVLDHSITRSTLRGPGEFGVTKTTTSVPVAILYDV